MRLFDESENTGGESPPTPPTAGRKTERQSTRQTTSDDAFRESQLTMRRTVVLQAIQQGPRTCDEIVRMGLAHQSASAAINWLMRKGHIVDSGERRRTSMGRRAIVWRHEPNPVPLTRTRPTRCELEKRIEQALSLLQTCLVMNEKQMLALRILEGKESLDA